GAGRGREPVVERAADQVLHRLRAAAVGNVGEVDPDRRIKQHAGEMARRAAAGRAVLHLRLVGLRVGDELLEVVRGQVLAGDQHRRRLSDQRDRCEIGHRIVERRLVEQLAVGVGGAAAEQDLVSVGGGGFARGAGGVRRRAPRMFSTTTDCPRSSASRAATIRPATSIELPAVNEITMVTGRAGQSCALAAWAPAANAAATAIIVMLRMMPDMGSSLILEQPSRASGTRSSPSGRNARRYGASTPFQLEWGPDMVHAKRVEPIRENAMRIARRRFLCLAGAAVAAPTIISSRAWSQAYPDRPIRFIVPLAAGGGTDYLAR